MNNSALDAKTLGMAMDLASEVPLLDTGLTFADVVVREYERLIRPPAPRPTRCPVAHYRDQPCDFGGCWARF